MSFLYDCLLGEYSSILDMLVNIVSYYELLVPSAQERKRQADNKTEPSKLEQMTEKYINEDYKK